MDKVALNNAIADHVEVLHQYSTNANTNKVTLCNMIEDLLCKFTKKEYFYLAMEKFLCGYHNLAPENLKTDWDICFANVLNGNTFETHPQLTDQVIVNVKHFYKLKA
jgi:hypothetical protein